MPGRGPNLDLTRTYNSLTAGSEGIFGHGWTSSYETHLTVNSDSSVTVTEDDGSQVTYVPTSGGGFTGPSWSDTTLTSSGSTYTFVRQQTQTFTFNSSGQLAAISDPNGYTTTLSYSSGKLSTVTDPASRTITFTYGTNGLVSEVTNPDSQNTTYGYDSSGDLTSVTDPKGDITSFTYNSAHLMLTMTLPNGQSGGPDAGHDVVNTCNSSGQVLTQTDPAGLETQYSYTGTISPPRAEGPLSPIPTGTWRFRTTPTASSFADQGVRHFGHGYLDLQLRSQHARRNDRHRPNSHTTTNTYDTNGNLLTSEDADGNTTAYTYNSFDEPLTVTDPKGIVTTFTYNSDGDVLTRVITGVGGSPTETTYYTYGDGNAGDLTQVQDPDGHITTYTYDTYGDRTSTATYPTTAITTSATSAADHFASPPTITAVGSFTSNDAAGLSTLADNPQTVGDVLEVFAQSGSASLTVTSISGGGVSTWTKEKQFSGSFGGDTEIWYGQVTSTGSSTITFSWSGSITGHTEEYGVQEFTAGLGANTVWTVDKTGSGNGASSTSVPFPSLTPSGSSELYFAYAGVANIATGGTTSGFTFTVTAQGNLATYDTNVSSTASPTGTQTPAGVSSAVAALLSASSSAGPTVTGVSPSSGSSAGGTSVALTGTNFTGATAVTFGSIPAASFTVNSATSITATSPSGTPSVVDITVHTSGGTSATSSADHFTFTAASATITAVGSFTSNDAAGLSTLADNPQTVGDVLEVFAQSGSASLTVTSISGGGVSTWTKEKQFSGSFGGDTEIWYGKVTTTGSSTITFSWSGSITGLPRSTACRSSPPGWGPTRCGPWTRLEAGTVPRRPRCPSPASRLRGQASCTSPTPALPTSPQAGRPQASPSP